MAMTQAQLNAQRRYQNRVIAQVLVKLHREKDADILEKLETVESKNGYIKECIRRDLARERDARERDEAREQEE